MSTIRIGGGAGLGTLPADVAAALAAAQAAYDAAQSAATQAISALQQASAALQAVAELADVASSGSYNDLSDKPSIPAEPVNADWAASTGLAQILNKPDLPNLAFLSNGTEASITALIGAQAPDHRVAAMATDRGTLYYWDGYNWYELTAYLNRNLSTPDMGCRQDSNLSGYGRDYVAAKTLTQCSIGGNDYPSEGGLRKYADPILSNVFQGFLNSAWQTFVTGFRFKLDTVANCIRTLDFGGKTINLTTGNSTECDMRGIPIVQGWRTSMGCLQPDPIYNGGSF